ncbi:NUDIX hydrolase [Paenibacillus tepidiphilus]|uniref:NUDIX hydrolase n=1 Tax=Paenibacillus tepidiphilus TaxID=2608683 RepID=UPI00123C34F0|nr:NUDIX domain-containing protein [Paenibacillus tepidiphilus]
MKVNTYESGIDEKQLMYVVIFVKQGEDWVLARHRERSTWEFAGGHIEVGETAAQAAARELYEETGAGQYVLYPVCVYSVEREDIPLNYGKLFYAEVQDFGTLPGYEMAEIRRFSELPEALTYPLIYPVLHAKVTEFLAAERQSVLPTHE